jgi:hypothetical protein
MARENQLLNRDSYLALERTMCEGALDTKIGNCTKASDASRLWRRHHFSRNGNNPAVSYPDSGGELKLLWKRRRRRTIPAPTSTMNSFQPGDSSSHPFHEPAPLPASIPKVNDVGATSAPLKSAAFFIGAYCKEFNGRLRQVLSDGSSMCIA